jgi:hypothetical protein
MQCDRFLKISECDANAKMDLHYQPWHVSGMHRLAQALSGQGKELMRRGLYWVWRVRGMHQLAPALSSRGKRLVRSGVP